jgi:hypothetical protein
VPRSAPSAAAGFVARANSICASANSAINALPRPTRNAQIRPYVDAAVPIIDRGVADLKALTPPPDERAGYQRYLSALGQVVTLDHRIRADADNGSNGTIVVLNHQLDGIHAKEHAAAKLLGLTQCAKEPSQ